MGVLGLGRAVVAKEGFGDSGAVLVYDPTVERVGVLLGGLDAGCTPVPVSGADVCQVLSELLRVGSVHTIHLLGHGAPGGIFFENVFINGILWTGLARGTECGRASSSIQTINFWSCETGRGETGMKFLKHVADTTGATVHGSDQKVGSPEHGGSWDLNQIASPRPPFSKVSRDSFEGVLMATITTQDIGGTNVITAFDGDAAAFSAAVSTGDGTAQNPYVSTGFYSQYTVSGSPSELLGLIADQYAMYSNSNFEDAVTLNLSGGTDGSPITLGQLLDLQAAGVDTSGQTIELSGASLSTDDAVRLIASAPDGVNAFSVGAEPLAVSQSDISVTSSSTTGTLAKQDDITVTYQQPAGATVNEVWFDLSGFTAGHDVDYSTWDPQPSESEMGFVQAQYDSATDTWGATLTISGPNLNVDGDYANAGVLVVSTGSDGTVNYSLAIDDESFFVDNDSPVVDSIELLPGSDTGESDDDSITNADQLVFQVDFSEPVVGLGRDDFSASVGAVEAVAEVSSPDGSSYLVTVGGVSDVDDLLTLSVNSHGIYDAAGNQIQNSVSSSPVNLDNTGPTIISIERPASNKYSVDTGDSNSDGVTNANSLEWVVRTSEVIDVATLDGADFVLTGVSVTGPPAISIVDDPVAPAGSVGKQFVVTVTGGFDDADAVAVGLALSPSSSFADVAGNLGDATADDGATNNETYTVDNTPLAGPGVSLENDTGTRPPFVETDAPGNATVFDVFEIPINDTGAPVEVVIDRGENSSFSDFIMGYHGGGAAIGYREKGTTEWLGNVTGGSALNGLTFTAQPGVQYEFAAGVSHGSWQYAFTAEVGPQAAVKLLNADSYSTWPDSRFSGYAGEGKKTVANERSIGETHGTYPGDDYTADGSVVVTTSADSYGTRYSVDDGLTWVNDASALAITTEGSYTVMVQQVDQAGNWSASTQVTFTLDTTGPSSAIVARTAGDSGVDTDGQVSFTVTLNEPVDPTSVGVEDFVVAKTGGMTAGTDLTLKTQDFADDAALLSFIQAGGVDANGNSSWWHPNFSGNGPLNQGDFTTDGSADSIAEFVNSFNTTWLSTDRGWVMSHTGDGELTLTFDSSRTTSAFDQSDMDVIGRTFFMQSVASDTQNLQFYGATNASAPAPIPLADGLTTFTVSPQDGEATDTFTVTVPYDGEGTVELALGAVAEFIDRAGNTGSTFTASSASVDVDNVGPTPTISIDESVVDAGDMVTVNVSFDGSLDGSPSASDVIGALSTPGLTLSGTPSASGDVYTATFVAAAATQETGYQISIAADAFSDANGNGTAAATSNTYDVDSLTPVITAFDVSGPDSTYGPGDTIYIYAVASEDLVAGSVIRATLTNGEVVTLTTNGGPTLTGNYVVDGTDTGSADLDVSSFALGDGVTPGSVPADQAGNVMSSTALPPNMIADTQQIVVDTTAPALISIERASDSPNITNSPEVLFEVTFDGPVDMNSIDAAAFEVSNGVVSGQIGPVGAPVGGASFFTSYTVPVTATADGDVGLSLATNSFFVDAVGNVAVHDVAGGVDMMSGVTVETYAVDTAANPISAQILESQGQWHDGVISPNMHQDKALFDVGVTGKESGSTVEFSLDNTSWTTNGSDLRDQVVEGVNTVYVRHTDLAGNISEATTSVTVDLTAPVMTGMTDGAGVDTAGTVTFTMDFSEPVLTSSIGITDFDFAGGDLAATGVTATGVAGTGNTATGYTSIDVTFTGISGEGNFAAALATAAGYQEGIYDLAGNAVQFETGEDRLSADNVGVQAVDTVGATVTGITRVPDLDTSVKNDTGSSTTDGVTDADVLTFRVDFSEPVDGASLVSGIVPDVVPNFDIVALQSSDNTDVASAFTNASVSVTNLDGSAIDGDPGSVLVTVSGNDIVGFDGSVGIATKPGITDVHGNSLTGLAVGVSAEVYALDNTAPTVTVDVDRAVLNNNSDSATVTFTFDEPVDGLGYADITVPASGTLTNLSEASPNDGTVWTATFTANSAVDLSGEQFAVSGFADQFGQTNDGTGNTYDSFDIDTVAPTVTVGLSSSAIKAGDTVTVTLTSSEPLVGLGTESDELLAPNLISAGPATSNPDGTVWTKIYTADADIDDPTNVITLLAGEAIDVAANPSVADSVSANYVVDTVDPLLSTIDDASGTSTNGDLTFRVTFSEQVDANSVSTSHFTTSVAGPGITSAGGVSSVSPVGTAVDGGYHQYDVLVSGAGGDAGTTVTLSYTGGFTVADMVGNTGGLDQVQVTIPAVTNTADGKYNPGNDHDVSRNDALAPYTHSGSTNGANPPHSADLYDLPIVDSSLAAGQVKYSLTITTTGGAGDYFVGVFEKGTNGEPVGTPIATFNDPDTSDDIAAVLNVEPQPGVEYVVAVSDNINWSHYDLMFEYVADGATAYTAGEVPASVNIADGETIPALTLTVDAAGDTGTGAVDTVLPEVSSVERVAELYDTGVSATDNVTNSDTVVFKVTFTETMDLSTLSGVDFELVGTPALAGVNAPTISLVANPDGTGTPTADSDVVFVKASGGDLAVYTGDLTLGLASASSIEDMAGNVSSVAADDSATTQSYALDNTAPDGTTMSMHYNSQFQSVNGVVRADDELELQYHGVAHSDIETVVFDVGQVTGAGQIALTTADTWTESDISALRLHLDEYVHNDATVQQEKQEASDAFVAQYADPFDPSLVGTTYTGAGFTVGSFSIADGHVWEEQDLNDLFEEWHHVRYNDADVLTASADARDAFVAQYADPEILTANDSVAQAVDIASQTVAGFENDGGAGTFSAFVRIPVDGVNNENTTVTVTVTDTAGNVFTDTVGNFLVDNQSPDVELISTVSASDSGAYTNDGLTNADTVQFRVVFDDEVTQVAIDDFEVVTSGTLSPATVQTVENIGGDEYIVTVGGVGLASGDGTVDLRVDAAATVYDLAGNLIDKRSTSSDQSYVVDNTGASVVSFTTDHEAGDHIRAGETVTITATMSEAVQDGGQITVNLSSGGSAVLTADAEGATLSGTYTVLASENADTLSVDTIVLNGSAPVDLAGNMMTDTTVPAADLSASTIEVDTVADQGSDLSVTVHPLDLTTSDAESGHVSFLIEGVDTDNASVVLTVSDIHGSSSWADAVLVKGAWVASVDVGGLADQSFLASSVSVTDTAGNVATVTAGDTIFLDMSADADNNLSVAINGTGANADGPVGFEVAGVDIVDTVALQLNLQTGDGNASLQLSVDPEQLGVVGLGLLGRAVDAADTANELLASLDATLTPALTDAFIGRIEAELGIEQGTFRALTNVSRDDVADAMLGVSIDPRLVELVQNATREELQDLAVSVDQDPEIQELIDQGGALLTAGQIFGVVNGLRLDFSQIDSLLAVDPDAVRASADDGEIGTLISYAETAGVAVPDVTATLDRLVSALDQEIGDVDMVGIDRSVGTSPVLLSLDFEGGTHSNDEIPDQLGLTLEVDGAPQAIDQSLYSSVGSENGNVNWGGLSGFGNGATFDAGVIDPVHGQVFKVSSGEGYAPDVNSGFAAFTGAFSGIDGYDTFNVKVTDTPSGVVEVKLIGGTTDSVVHVTLATDPNATDLGGGWYELSIPFSQFSNNSDANLASHSGFLIGMPGDNGATPFDFYFTDVEVAGIDYSGVSYVSGLTARDFLSIGQNLATMTDTAGDAVIGIDEHAIMRVGLSWDEAGTMRSPLAELGKGELTATVSVTDVHGNTNSSPEAKAYVDPDFTLDMYAAPLEGIDIENDTNAQVTTAPEHMLFSGDGNHDGAMWNGVDTFGNGAVFDATVMDADHGHVFKVTSGEGYGADVQVAFAAFTGHGAGFVAGYDVFNAKVKGSPDGTVEVKLLGGTDSVAVVDTATYPGSTDLGGGWYELSIPFTEFSHSDAANMAAHTGWLIGPPGDQADTPFDFFFTDVGFAGDRITSDGSLTAPTNVEMTDGLPADVYYSLDGTTWESDYSKLSLAQGTNTVSFKQVDEAGNESAVRSVTFEYDDVAPALDSIADTLGVGTDVDTTAHQFMVSFSEPVDPGSVSPANFVAAGPGASIVSVTGVGAMIDGGYTAYNIGVTGSGEGVLSLALNTAVTFADIAGNAGDSFTAGVTDLTGELSIDTVHPTVTGIERVPESDTGLPGGETNADVLVYKVSLSQAIDGSTIDGGDFEIAARDLGGALVAIDDATLTVRSGAAADAAVVSGGEHDEVYVHVQSATLASLDGDAKLVLASADPVPVEQNLYSSDNTENGNVNWDGLDGFGNGATFDAGVIDPTHGQVFSVASGEGYGVNVGFVAFTNWGNPAGFEVMETFNVKVKGLPTDVLEIKMITGEPTPDSVAQVNISDTTISQDLGDGWHQLTIPAARFSNPDHLSTHSGWLIGHPGDTGPTPFEFYFTDVSVGSTQHPAGADFADPNGNLVDVSGRLITEAYDLDNTISTPSVGTIAIDDIVNDAESGSVVITLDGVDTDVVTTVVSVTAASNIDVVTGLPVDASLVELATGSGLSWSFDATVLPSDGNYVVLVAAIDDAGNASGATRPFSLDTTISTPSVGTIAVDNIVNDAEDGLITITLSGVDTDGVTTAVSVTAASNVDVVTGLPVDASLVELATGSGLSWSFDTTSLPVDGDYVVLAGAVDAAGNPAGAVKPFTLDTEVLPPVTVLVEATHSDMTASEAAEAFSVTVEENATWTVELTGTKHSAARLVQDEMADNVADAAKNKADADALVATDLGILELKDAILQVEASGLETWESVVSNATDARDAADSALVAAQTAYQDAITDGTEAFVEEYGNPDELIAHVVEVDDTTIPPTTTIVTQGSEVDSLISLPGLNMAPGEFWTESTISSLRSAMSDFLDSAYSVTDLGKALEEAEDQLIAAEADLTDKVGRRDEQAGFKNEAQENYDSALEDWQASVAIAETRATELSDAQTAKSLADDAVADATVVLSGTGTGNAETISLSGEHLEALGDGQVVIKSTATDIAGNTGQGALVSFNLDRVDPSAPSIDSWATDTNIPTDGVTSDNTLTLTVTGEPGGTPTLYVDGEVLTGGPSYSPIFDTVNLKVLRTSDDYPETGLTIEYADGQPGEAHVFPHNANGHVLAFFEEGREFILRDAGGNDVTANYSHDYLYGGLDEVQTGQVADVPAEAVGQTLTLHYDDNAAYEAGVSEYVISVLFDGDGNVVTMQGSGNNGRMDYEIPADASGWQVYTAYTGDGYPLPQTGTQFPAVNYTVQDGDYGSGGPMLLSLSNDSGMPGQPLVAVETAPVQIISTGPATVTAGGAISDQDVYAWFTLPEDQYLVYSDDGESIPNLYDRTVNWTEDGDIITEMVVAVESGRDVSVATMINDAQVILGTADEMLGNWTRYPYTVNSEAVTIDVPDSAAGSMIQVGTNSVYKYGSYDYEYDQVELFLVDGDGQVIGAGIGALAGGLETQFEVPEGASGVTVIAQPRTYYVESTNFNQESPITEATLTVYDLPLGEASGPGFTWTEDSAGVYTVSTDELEHEFAGDLTVTITDAAGNESAHSSAVTVSVDNLKPSAPTLAVADDTGVDDTANAVLLTNDVSLTLTVISSEPGDLRLYDGGKLISDADYSVSDQVVSGGDTEYTVTFVQDAVDGDTFALSATITDVAGNESDHSSVRSVQIDRTAPDAPSLTVADDTGVDDTLNAVLLTNDDTPTVTVTTSEMGAITLYDDGVEVPSSDYTVSSPALVNLLSNGGFGDGTVWSGNAFNVVDGVNKADVGSAGNPWDVNLSGDVAVVSGETYTLTFEAKGAEGRTLLAGIGDKGAPYHNHTETVTLSADWETYTVHLTAKDFANGGGFSAETRVIFDMGADAGAVDLDNVSLTPGHVGAQFKNADQTELLSDGGFDDGTGTVWSGNAFNIVDGVNKADVGVAGNPWDVNLSGHIDLVAGERYYTMTFDAKGAEGRTLIAGIGDKGAPYHNHSETVTLSSEWETYTLYLSAKHLGDGAAFSNETRVIFDMGADAGAVELDNVSVVAGHDGRVGSDAGQYEYTVTFDEAIAHGDTRDLSVTLTDDAGNESAQSSVRSVEIDTVAPEAPAIALVNDTLGDVLQGDTATDGITKNSELTLTVTGEPGGLLILEDNGAELAPQSVTDNGDGTYTVVTGKLDDGAHALAAKVRDDAGNISDAGTLTVTVDTAAPVVTIDSVGDITDGSVQISGTAEKDRDVVLTFSTDDGADDHQVTVATDGNGVWTYDLTNDDMLVIGQGEDRTVSISQFDAAGNEGTTDSEGVLASRTFTMNTTTHNDGNVVGDSQLNQGSSPDGSVITGDGGAFVDGGNTLDLSQVSGDVRVDLKALKKQIQVDTDGDRDWGERSADIDQDIDAFVDTLITGAGDDLLIGTELVDIYESFDGGLGNNIINAGDGIDRLLTQASLGTVSAAQTTSADGKVFSLALAPNSDLYGLRVGQSGPAESFATLAALVVALEAQFAAANGGTNPYTVSADESAKTVTVTSTDTVAVAALSDSGVEITAQYLGGVDVDLSPVYGTADYTGAGTVLRADGSFDLVIGIEDVLGTAYDDVLRGQDLEAYLADGGDAEVASAIDDDNVLDGQGGNDRIYGGSGDDRIIGGAGADLLYGGAGRDTFVISDDLDTIGDFNVSSFMTSVTGRNTVYDRVEFAFTDDDIRSELGNLPAEISLEAKLGGENGDLVRTLELHIIGADGESDGVLGSVDLSWESVEALYGSLDPDTHSLTTFLIGGNTLSTGAGAYTANATVEFVRDNQIDDAAGDPGVLLGAGGESDDIFVSTDGDDIVMGGLGADVYETRILGASDGRDLGTETLSDLGGASGSDVIFFEGVRDLGDLYFSRTTLAREGEGRTLEVGLRQYRSDNPDTVEDESGTLHAYGTVELFNQFSLSQSDLYKVEELQIAEESVNPLDSAVQSYVFGEVTESAETGDTLSASANEATILIGTTGKNDEYVIDMAGAVGNTEVWIFGDDAGSDTVTITGLTEKNSETTEVNHANGEKVQKVTKTFEGTEAILDLYFADGGNVNSTDLLNKIQYEV